MAVAAAPRVAARLSAATTAAGGMLRGALRGAKPACPGASGAQWAAAGGHKRQMSDLVAEARGSLDLRLAFGVACRPHPDKIRQGGEDAYYACPDSQSFGVADGVGSWAESGVDAGRFAKALMSHSHRILQQTSLKAPRNLNSVFREAISCVHRQALEGSCTAVLVQLTGRTLSILNLGDSGVIVLRPALRVVAESNSTVLFPRVLFRSCDQTHYFNCPYQVAGSGPLAESPDMIQLEVRQGDLVFAATDGVFDNLFDHQVQSIVAQYLGQCWRDDASVVPELHELAESVCEEAQRIGYQEEKDIITPIVLSANAEGLTFRGGKLDDTTAVLAAICDQAEVREKAARGTDKKPLFHNFV